MIGRLITPRHVNNLAGTVSRGHPWAADSDGFRGVHLGRYHKMLSLLAENHDGCVFVAAPDKITDAEETTWLFYKWYQHIRDLGLPVAYVLQDGVTASSVPWDECQALFVGGSTDFKLGRDAARLVQIAKSSGKWVHMGRVNSYERAMYAKSIGCDSFDGSKWGRWPDKHIEELVMILNEVSAAYA